MDLDRGEMHVEVVVHAIPDGAFGVDIGRRSRVDVLPIDQELYPAAFHGDAKLVCRPPGAKQKSFR